MELRKTFSLLLFTVRHSINYMTASHLYAVYTRATHRGGSSWRIVFNVRRNSLAYSYVNPKAFVIVFTFYEYYKIIERLVSLNIASLFSNLIIRHLFGNCLVFPSKKITIFSYISVFNKLWWITLSLSSSQNRFCSCRLA